MRPINNGEAWSQAWHVKRRPRVSTRPVASCWKPGLCPSNEEIRETMKRTLAALLIAGFCMLSSGCANPCWVYQPFGPGTLCTGGPCDDGGCSTCGVSSCGSCGSCATSACSSCARPASSCCAQNTSCDACGNSCSPTCASPCGPLTWLFNVLNAGYCGDGCGEIWWGDFHSAPPSCCEPCNRHGDWTGSSRGTSYGSSGGCSSCGGGSTIDYTFQNQPRVLSESSTPISQAAKPISTVQR